MTQSGHSTGEPSPGRLKAVSPESKEGDEGCTHRRQHRTSCDNEGCDRSVQLRRLLHFIELVSRSFDPRQLEIIQVVLDQAPNLVVPNARSKTHLYLLFAQGFEVSEQLVVLFTAIVVARRLILTR